MSDDTPAKPRKLAADSGAPGRIGTAKASRSAGDDWLLRKRYAPPPDTPPFTA